MSDDFTGADISSAMSTASSDASGSPDSSVSPATQEPSAQPGAATTQPAAVPTTQQQPQQPAKPQGPIPFDVHTRSMDNARAKAVEEYKAKYGWAETVDRNAIAEAVALANRFRTDRVAAIRDLIAEAHADPQLSAQLRSEAARLLAAGRSTPMPEPDVDITDANGNVVERTFSSAQWAKREAWLKEQWMGEVDKKFAPLVKTHQTLEQQRQQAHDEAEGQKFANGLMGELKAYPHFEANKAAIGADVVEQIKRLGDDPRTNDPAWLEAATLRAYHRVVTTKQDALSRQAAVHDLTTKASNSGVVPGRQPVGAPKRDESGRFTGADIAAEFARRKMG